eukprot:1521997-Rhodomonas_salina.2
MPDARIMASRSLRPSPCSASEGSEGIVRGVSAVAMMVGSTSELLVHRDPFSHWKSVDSVITPQTQLARECRPPQRMQNSSSDLEGFQGLRL